MNEDFLENLKLNVAFNSVKYLIENNETNLKESSKIYVGWVKDYFESAIKSIDSILDFEDSKGYFITPHLLEIVKSFEENKNPNSVQRAKDIRNKFLYINSSLDRLRENPREFYGTIDSKMMLEHFNNFSYFFDNISFKNQ